jgi:hypothetical protein
VIGGGRHSAIEFRLFDTVFQTATTIDEVLDLRVDRLFHRGIEMELHRPLSFYQPLGAKARAMPINFSDARDVKPIG